MAQKKMLDDPQADFPQLVRESSGREDLNINARR